MSKAIAYLRANPIMAGALAILIIAIVYFAISSPKGPQGAVSTTPGAGPSQPSVSPAMPAPQASPSGQAPAPQASPTPGPRAMAAPSDAGRPDPFLPIVRGGPGSGARPGSVPAPPPAPLPPPLFPGQQQQQPAPAVTPPPPPKEASGAVLVGIVGDNGSVAIIRLGRETYIVSPGDVIKDKIKVTVIDVAKSIVIIEQEGERFELRMGGVSGRNVAA
jgi:hypothetical protein